MNCYSFCRLPPYTPEPLAPVYAFIGATGKNTAPLTVLSSGTDLALPEFQVFSQGITANPAGTALLIQIPGVYRLAYYISTVAPTLASSRITVNGSEVDATVLTSSTPRTQYALEAFLYLGTGDSLSLQLFHETPESVALQHGVGATLSLEKIG
ncbi:MAG: hypothetical protein LUG13_00620 [Oscillospiraceae bacterium]|nr:hypothetical protein [Oscillospiraceae bacterium]